MVPVITFIGWHNSGKTTLVARVVAELKKLRYRVGVIKSTSEAGIEFDTPDTDTYKHKQAGADRVMLVAPDQTVLQARNDGLPLTLLAQHYFPDVDIVIGEGFKKEGGVDKIEVFVAVDEHLRDEVPGVVAVATNLDGVDCKRHFSLNAAAEIAQFIAHHYIEHKKQMKIATFRVGGRELTPDENLHKLLAGLLQSCVGEDGPDAPADGLDIRITLVRSDS